MKETNGLPFRPLFARVLLERDTVKKKGSIILPDSVAGRYSPTKGVVLAVGETCDDSVKALVGKRVFFAKYAGDWIKINETDEEENFFICQDEDILGEIYE